HTDQKLSCFLRDRRKPGDSDPFPICQKRLDLHLKGRLSSRLSLTFPQPLREGFIFSSSGTPDGKQPCHLPPSFCRSFSSSRTDTGSLSRGKTRTPGSHRRNSAYSHRQGFRTPGSFQRSPWNQNGSVLPRIFTRAPAASGQSVLRSPPELPARTALLLRSGADGFPTLLS